MKNVKTYSRHLRLPILLMGLVAVFSGCQNRGTGLWGSQGYSERFLNDPRNMNYFASLGGDAVGYIVYGNSNVSLPTQGGQGQGGAPNRNAGGVKGQNGQNNAGEVAGGSGNAATGTPCTFKVSSASPANLVYGSAQNYGQRYYETSQPSSGRGIYAPVFSAPINCSRDSEVAATANAFYVTAGSNGEHVFVYKVNLLGAYQSNQALYVPGGPTRIAASPSGHIAVVHNGNQISFFLEDRMGGDGSWVADALHTKTYPANEKVEDVVIDDRQGGMYVVTSVKGGMGKFYVYNMHEAFMGIYRPYFNSWDYLNQRNYNNFTMNQDETVFASTLFQFTGLYRLKNFDGLTGIMTSAGRPMFSKTILQINANAKTTEELDQQYQDAIVGDIRIFDPFMLSQQQQQSQWVQQNGSLAQYKDFAVGNNVTYLLQESGTVVTAFVDEFYPIDMATPITGRAYVGRANTIEMSYDQRYAIITGTTGLSIARVAGNNLVFASNGRPDISESAEVIHAASLGKVTTTPVPAAPAEEAPATPTK